LDFHTCTSIRTRKVGPRSPQYGTGGEWSTQVLLGVRRVVAQRCGGRHGQTAWGPAGAGRLGLSVLCSRGARQCQCSAICGAHRTAGGLGRWAGACGSAARGGDGWLALAPTGLRRLGGRCVQFLGDCCTARSTALSEVRSWQRQALTLVGVETSCCRLVAVYSYYGEVVYGGDYGRTPSSRRLLCLSLFPDLPSCYLCFPISRPASCVPYLLMSAACYYSTPHVCSRCTAVPCMCCVASGPLSDPNSGPVELQYHLRRFFLLAGLPPWLLAAVHKHSTSFQGHYLSRTAAR
jgi:hypothetical protein